MRERNINRRQVRTNVILKESAIEPLEDRLLMSTYRVTTLGDSLGVVTPTSPGHFNATTLRGAINAANSHRGADTIIFADTVRGQLYLKNALPHISDGLAVIGPGHRKLTVWRDPAARSNFSVFFIDTGTKATISNLSIVGGTGTSVGNDQRGGGIYNAGILTVADCVIAGNYAHGRDNVRGAGEGGGIYNSGILSVFRSIVSGNVASGGAMDTPENRGAAASGGGIFSEQSVGSTLLSRCSISGNLAAGGNGSGVGGTASGGGISCLTSLKLVRCTVAGNNTYSPAGQFGGESRGGGIDSTVLVLDRTWVADNRGIQGVGVMVGDLVATNSTFSGNRATDTDSLFVGGGGLFVSGPGKLTNCTIVGNRGAGGGICSTADLHLTNCTVVRNAGGGIELEDGLLALNNSIVAENYSDFDNTPRNIDGFTGHVTSDSAYNVIGTGASGGIVNGRLGNHVGVTPSQLKLGSFGDHGGDTWTVPLLPGSVAINAGSTPRALDPEGHPLLTDQRGGGFDRVVGNRVDIGAFEVQ
jgi:hypothetical protein